MDSGTRTIDITFTESGIFMEETIHTEPPYWYPMCRNIVIVVVLWCVLITLAWGKARENREAMRNRERIPAPAVHSKVTDQAVYADAG